MSNPNSSAAAAGQGKLQQNVKGNDVKEHVAGCQCDKCTYFQVTPMSKSVKDGKDGAVGTFEVNRPIRVSELLRNRMGMKKVKGKGGVATLSIVVPYSFAMSCDNTGVVAQAQAVLADSNAVEWAALANIYDEYRVTGGRVEFHPTYQTPVAGTGGFSIDKSFFVLGYDPVDFVALTSVRNGCELSHHKLLCGQLFGPNTLTSTGVMGFCASTSKPAVLKWRAAPVAALGVQSSGVLNTTPGMWKQINSAGNNSAEGYLKSYGTTDYSVVATVVSGIVYLNCEFRSRK